MERYKNLGGDSSVAAFEIANGAITVEFNDHSQYLYTNESAGAESISEMHRLARAGKGLCSYILRFARKRYARKIR